MSALRRHPPAGRAVLSQLPASPNAPAVLTDCAASYEHVLTATVAAPPFPYHRRPGGGCPRQGRAMLRSTQARSRTRARVFPVEVVTGRLIVAPGYGKADYRASRDHGPVALCDDVAGPVQNFPEV